MCACKMAHLARVFLAILPTPFGTRVFLTVHDFLLAVSARTHRSIPTSRCPSPILSRYGDLIFCQVLHGGGKRFTYGSSCASGRNSTIMIVQSACIHYMLTHPRRLPILLPFFQRKKPSRAHKTRRQLTVVGLLFFSSFWNLINC